MRLAGARLAAEKPVTFTGLPGLSMKGARRGEL